MPNSGLRIETILLEKTAEAIKALYDQFISPSQISLQKTKIEFEGDITLLVFPLTKVSKKSPEETANALGNYLKEHVAEVTAFNVVKGFLNLVIADSYWVKYLAAPSASTFEPQPSAAGETVMVEFSSPNTNKPLHLGHVRNNLLGISVSAILKAAGKKVIRVNLVNDRGIHICKSMLAWKKWGNGETPESSGLKGDHLVGKYYVLYDELYKKELDFAERSARELYRKFLERDPDKKMLGLTQNQWMKLFAGVLVFTAVAINTMFKKKDKNSEYQIDPEDMNRLVSEELDWDSFLLKQSFLSNDVKTQILEYKNRIEKSFRYSHGDTKDNFEHVLVEIKKQLPIINDVQEMLRKWEAGDEETIDLWKKMNGWVYDGFAKTYKELGVEFEKTYYESETYLLGKKIGEEGLSKGVFKKKDDGSVWIDLTADGLDEKLLLRSDGTSVYITQDIGTIIQRAKEFHFDRHIYVVGNEQDYHFKVLFLIIKKLAQAGVEGLGPLSFGEGGERGALFHLSYGMVDLPSGKMKSREGTVVDADELMEEMVNTARETTKALGKTEGLSETEAEQLYHNIGLGALKYFILKVDPKKRMLFDPKESIDFNGNTGPFIQYTYARIKSVLRKAESVSGFKFKVEKLQPKEKAVIKLLHGFPQVIQEAAAGYNPGHIANYVYDLAKEYNTFYHECPILKAENTDEKNFRLELSAKTSVVIKTSLGLLGIQVSERM